MSGIVGIYNIDGSPVSRDCLLSLTESLRYRGPDAQKVWCDFEVGFGHALLDTTGGRTIDEQPCSLDGKVSIVADARLDAKSELTEKLRSRGFVVLPGAPDGQLILLAYHAWGEGCIHHLLGDFAFAIWNKPHKQLFCARDHFGIKPFYYAGLKGSFIFSNTLNCLRLHPDITSRLNDLAICDYLLFGGNQNPATTSFDQIQRLAPAHSLSCSEGKLRVSQYWKPPLTSEIRFNKAQDYVDRFQSLLTVAVRDRLPPGSVSVLMSGGLDSSAVAAVAATELGLERRQRLRAHTGIFEQVIPDSEGHFARKVSDFCSFDIQFLIADGYQLFQHWHEGDFGPAELCDQPLRAIRRDLYKQIVAHSRVVFTGEGGDACLLPSPRSVINLLKTGRLWNLAAGYAHCGMWQRTLPRVGLRSLMWRDKKTEDQTDLPEWINPELIVRFDLKHRAGELDGSLAEHPDHHRPEAYKKLANGCWANHLELCDPTAHSQPVETRNPFFDVRLVEFLLNLPTLPWCVGKQILRQAMAGFLPQEVLLRKKSPLVADPVVELLKRPQSGWIDHFEPVPELAQYVNPSLIPPITKASHRVENVWLHLRPLTLDHWLRR